MPLVVKDRVKETTTTAGTGTITLAGAVSGYQSFSVIGNGNTTYYTIVGGTEWEVGIGTYTSSGTTLSRDTVLESSTGGTKVDFAAGVKDVFVTYPAERSVTSDYANTFTDSQVISVDSTSAALRITQINTTGNALLVEDEANPDSTPTVITSAGRVIVGYTTNIAGNGSVNSFIQQHGTTNATSSTGLYDWSTNTVGGPILNFNKSKSGTIGTRGQVSSGDRLGTIIFGGDDNTNFVTAGQISCLVDGTPGANNIPGRLTFSTSTAGAVTEKMRINSAGDVGIGTLTPTAKLETYGAIQARPAATQDAVAIAGRAGGTSSYVATITPTTLNANQTITLPDATGTVALLNTAQTFTAVQTLTDPAIIGAITEDIFTITDGAAFEVDPGNGSIQLITLGASRTPKATNFAAGESLTLMVNDGTAYTLTWTDTTWGTSGVIWVGGVAPTLATTGYTVIEFWKVGTQVYGALVGSVA